MRGGDYDHIRSQNGAIPLQFGNNVPNGCTEPEEIVSIRVPERLN